MHTVVALANLETALSVMNGNCASGVDSQSLHALPVTNHVRFSDQDGLYAERVKVMSDVLFTNAERRKVGGCSVRRYVPSRIDAHA